MRKKTINKWTLYKNSMLGVVIFGICIGIFIFILSQIATFFSPDPLEWLESITFGIMGAGLVSFLIFSILTLSPINGLFKLTKQEKVLNISFSEEMAKHNITETIYKNDQWFITTKEVTIVAIRRDYIQRIHKIKDPNGKKVRLNAILITSNGKKLRIAGSYDYIKKFEKWYLQTDSINLNK